MRDQEFPVWLGTVVLEVQRPGFERGRDRMLLAESRDRRWGEHMELGHKPGSWQFGVHFDETSTGEVVERVG